MADHPTELVTPTTPTTTAAAMADKTQSERAGLSALADLASSPPPTVARVDRVKYSSPPPPSSSMTPPPSSQLPQRLLSPGSPTFAPESQTTVVARTPTPTTSLLSSPPLTVAQTVVRAKNAPTEHTFQLPTPEQLSIASTAELRTMLHDASSEVQKLRMLSAHLKLQHTLLSIETEEATKRMAVEHDMTRREVEILLLRNHAEGDDPAHVERSPAVERPSDEPSHARMAAELRHHCLDLQSENEVIGRRLRKAKRVIQQRDGEVSTLIEENQRLKQRIKENREHVNRLRRPGGLYDVATPRSSDTVPVTPQRNTPRSHIAGSARSTQVASARQGGEDTFAALLLADQVLSQENRGSAPSTPARRGAARTAQPRHSRGSQSMSSLPSTPQQSRPTAGRAAGLLPPVSFPSTPEQPEPQHQGDRTDRPVQTPPPKLRRRESRDSTISAPEIEDASRGRAPDNDETDEDESDHVGQSNASQLATSMLRRAPPTEGMGTPTGKSSGLLQTKLFGKVTKPGVDRSPGTSLGKRKGGLDDEDGQNESQAAKLKRMRREEGVGLGIGGLAGPRTWGQEYSG